MKRARTHTHTHTFANRIFRSFGTLAFSVVGPTVWNSLPDSLRDPAVKSERFRRALQTHLSVKHERIRGVTVSRNRAIQIEIYLLTYTHIHTHRKKCLFVAYHTIHPFMLLRCRFNAASAAGDVNLEHYARGVLGG